MKSKGNTTLKHNILRAWIVGTAILTVLFCTIYGVVTKEVKDQAINSSKLSVKLYMQHIDDIFSKISQDLQSFLITDENLVIMEYTEDRSRWVLAVRDALMQLEKYCSLNRQFDYFFIYNKSQDKVLLKSNTGDEYAARQRIEETVLERIHSGGDDLYSGWKADDIDEKAYFMRFITNQTTVVGALTRIDVFLDDFIEATDGELDQVYFINENGQLLNNRSNEQANSLIMNQEVGDYVIDSQKYLGVNTASLSGNFSLEGMILTSELFSGLRRLRNILLLFCLLIAIYIWKMYRIMDERVTKQVNRIERAMKLIGQGDLNVRLEVQNDFSEFQTIKEHFNEMVTQIADLRIKVYEKKISEQKAELKFLQLQLNPHFLLNVFNVIYSLALTKNIELLKKMILSLTKHARYTLRMTDKLVPILEELDFIKNYVEIQKMRVNYTVQLMLDVEEKLLNERIPPLIIHTFIENSFKYSLKEDKNIVIKLKISECEKTLRVTEDGKIKSALCIHIEDNGIGLPENVLFKLERGEKIIDTQGQEHYGINNAMKRMNLIYGVEDTIRIYNSPGATVDIFIPENWEEHE